MSVSNRKAKVQNEGISFAKLKSTIMEIEQRDSGGGEVDKEKKEMKVGDTKSQIVRNKESRRWKLM